MTQPIDTTHHEQCPWHKVDLVHTRSVCGCPPGWPKPEPPDTTPAARPDDLGLSIDMLDADRLRGWADKIEQYGANISYWSDPAFVVAWLRAFAGRLDEAVRDIGNLRALAAPPTPAPESRSVQRRKAIMRGEPMPTFAAPAPDHEALMANYEIALQRAAAIILVLRGCAESEVCDQLIRGVVDRELRELRLSAPVPPATEWETRWQRFGPLVTRFMRDHWALLGIEAQRFATPHDMPPVAEVLTDLCVDASALAAPVPALREPAPRLEDE